MQQSVVTMVPSVTKKYCGMPHEMKKNDLWLNVKGNYVLFVENILLNL